MSTMVNMPNVIEICIKAVEACELDAVIKKVIKAKIKPVVPKSK